MPPCPRRPARTAAWRRTAAALGAWLLLGGHPTAAQATDNALPAAVRDALQRAQVPPDALAAVVLPLPRSGPRWQFQADRAMPPASTMKLVTSIVALDRLGPNHRGFTELLTRAPQQGDVLAGDLVLRGGADPELGLPQLWALLAELRHGQGIREIAGDIVLDRHLFRPARGDLGAAPFDAWPEFPYNVIPDALQVSGGLMAVEISAADPDQPDRVSARALPPVPGLDIDASALHPSDRACRDWEADWVSPPLLATPAPEQWRITLQGSFPRGCSQRVQLQLVDRGLLLERQLRWLWESLGGQWRGQVREATAPLIAPVGRAAVVAQTLDPPAGAPPAMLVAPGVAWAGSSATTPAGVRLLARRLARPWGEVLRTMNKRSDNPSTRLLYLSLGLAGMADEPEASTAELAQREVRRWLAEHQINPDGLVLDNGSGLSRSERLTPRQLALMLRAARHSRWAPELLTSLPVAGVDGTLRHRLQASPAAGWARLKTGTLKDSTALAGYVPDPQGRLWAVAAMVNHDNAAAARPALDALVDWVARGGMRRHGRRADRVQPP